MRKASSETTSADLPASAATSCSAGSAFFAFSAASAFFFAAGFAAGLSGFGSADTGARPAAGTAFGAAGARRRSGLVLPDVELELEIHGRIVKAAHRREGDFQLLGNVGERQSDLEARLGHLQVPVLELKDDRHLLG